MKSPKKMCLLLVVIGLCCIFTMEALADQVLYAPFETFLKSSPPKTTVYVRPLSNMGLQPWQCVYQNGQPPVTGVVGKAFYFNGSSYITVPNNSPWLDFGKVDFAISFWVKTTSTKTNNTVLDKRNGHKTPGYHVTIYQGRPLLHMQAAGEFWKNYSGGSGSKKVNDGNWHWVAIFVDRDNTTGGKIYIDGLCEHTFNPTVFQDKSINSPHSLLIGRHSATNNNNFVGTLDELRLFRPVPPRKVGPAEFKPSKKIKKK